ncbi:phasin family protein [Micromonospora endolithica]|uniref:Polyhydroxyalkanoate synthesis regulator phasin n=1 Tax=Micromonospora endolithica TaxID=230091 RepID=A0A3A9YP89_9ACTN|nr:hypothetical protein [Micromonospora endolithica]RKN37941.1 hypothetical protein D7223_31755 [Micromonospora endolithica]TWJ22478.1 polyhydroxyalkanoate synthesis regulator phasin [Micromonospora endolithica]
MQDAWRAYLELAMGLTEAPRKKAQDAVRRVVGQGGVTAGQIQALAEELVSTGAANREALTKLVRFEVDRALAAVGLATADEVAELTRRVHELERQLREAKTLGSGPATPPAAGPSVTTPTAAASVVPGGAEPAAPTTDAAPIVPGTPSTTTAVAKKAVAKKAVAKKAVAKKAVAKKAVALRPPADVASTGPADVTPAGPNDGTAAARPAEPVRPVKKAPARKRQPGGPA